MERGEDTSRYKNKNEQKTKFASKMDSSLLVVIYCKSHLGTFLFEMKQSPEKVMVILEEKITLILLKETNQKRAQTP